MSISTLILIITNTILIIFTLPGPASSKNPHIINFRSPNLYPESLTWDSSSQHFIVSSLRHPLVQSISSPPSSIRSSPIPPSLLTSPSSASPLTNTNAASSPPSTLHPPLPSPLSPPTTSALAAASSSPLSQTRMPPPPLPVPTLMGNTGREEFGTVEIKSEKESEEESGWVFVLIGLGLAYFLFWRFQMRQLVTNMNKKTA